MFAGEENSRVQAHIDGNEFSAHILTDEMEYNVEVTVSSVTDATTWEYVSIDVLVPFFLCLSSPCGGLQTPRWTTGYSFIAQKISGI